MRLAITITLWCGVNAAFAQAPSITTVSNAASFASGTLAPGSVASLFGSNLASATTQPASYPLPVYLGNASVYVNGAAAPLVYVSPGQINFQVPWETRLGAGSVVVIANSQTSNQANLQFAAAAPGIFTGWVYSSAYGSASQSVKLHAGEYLTILATGLGAVDSPPANGQTIGDSALTKVLAPVSVSIGGVPATVAFAGLAPPGPNPYAVGLYQINALVPANVPAGDAVPVVISASGLQSNPVNIGVAAGTANSVSKFVQIGPNSNVLARAITSQNTCPSISIDGRTQPMTVRAAPTLPFYPVLSCDTAVPATAQSVSMEGTAFKLPVQNPTRITVLGDTGCRMDNTRSQGCGDPVAWPVKAINDNAIATNPQLIVHNGDYHYREFQCFPNVAACQGSPWGYNWDVWREDLFKPFNGLLAAAPWIFVRGNHESCERAGEGYFRFLDPRPMPSSTCSLYTDPYALSIGSLQLIHLDSAFADDAIPYPDQIAAYQPQFDQVRAMAANSPQSWIITHRPIWGIRTDLNANVVLQAASNNDIGSATMILSGHTHTFQTYSFSPARAPQVVIGNSGDSLNATPGISLVGATVGNATVTNATSIDGGFGFATIAPAGEGTWTITSKDTSGATVATCSMKPTIITCTR